MSRARTRVNWRRLVLAAAGAALAPGWTFTFAQQPLPPTGPMPPDTRCAECANGRGGILHRFGRHTKRVLKDNFIGYPEYFVVPPVGTNGYEIIAAMKSKADSHEFTLYRSDFRAGTTHLSPGGAQRLSRMASRMDGWLGPLVVEWTPDQPDLAQQRRAQVLNLLAGAGIAAGPERVVVGPSQYAGLEGDEAMRQHTAQLYRYLQAPYTYSLPPIQTSTFGYGGTIR